MSVKWKDYLFRKGLAVEKWIDANGISTVDGLQTRLEQLGIVIQPDDVKLVEGILKGRAAPVAPPPQEVPQVVDDLEERPKRRRKVTEPTE